MASEKSPRDNPNYLQAYERELHKDAMQRKRVEAAKAAQLKHALWRKHTLDWKLEEHQLPVYERIKDAMAIPNSRFVLNASRRWGKSYLLCILAIEFAIANPRAAILYCASSQKQVRDIIVPTIAKIFNDCPKKIEGQLKTQTSQVVFPNGAWIRLTGLDGPRRNRLRGITADLVIVDEAGFVDGLGEAVQSVLGIMTASTGGATILSSNAPLSPGHEFVTIFTREAEEQGLYCKQTIHDVKKYTKEDIDRFARAAGGYESSNFKREYLCEFASDSNTAVIPEWSANKDNIIVHAVNRPDYFNSCVAGDLGYVDNAGFLFGYYDFIRGKMVVEDELLLKSPNSSQVVTGCQEKEATLWGVDGPPHRPFRVFDGNPFTVNDITTVHRYAVQAPEGKIPVESQVNGIRLAIQSGRLEIHSRCVQLIGQLADAKWNTSRSQFARDARNGHFDLLAALQYFVRYVNVISNPFPAGYNVTGDMRDRVRPDFRRGAVGNEKAYDGFRKLFAPKKEEPVVTQRVAGQSLLSHIFNGPKKNR
jgi:hypothetical protein